MERIEIRPTRRSARLSDGWVRSFNGRALVAIATLSMLVSLPSLAATSLDFVTSTGQFSIANGELTFTDDLTISAATVDGITDTSLIGATVELEPIALSADEITPIGDDVVRIGVTVGSLSLSIRQSIDAGGALLATATFVPGDLIVFFGTTGELSSEVASGLTGFVLEPAGGASSVLSSFAASADPIAIELGLSDASGDIVAALETDFPVEGSGNGSMAFVAVPEPSAAALTAAAMATLLLVTNRRQRGHRIEPPRS